MNPGTEILFVKNSLDRMDSLRGSIDHFLANTPRSQLRFILISGEELILQPSKTDYLFSYDEVTLLTIPEERSVFLGEKDALYYFVKEIDETQSHQLVRIGLRSFAELNLSSDHEMGVLAQAFSILKWHQSHLFCSSCGVKTHLARAGWQRDCPGCGKEHFPRTDPVVIMLVTYGNYCLLGSGLNFPAQRYSCLAGFMEPGETIEDAARRELFEEAGVIGGQVQYISSQPWPFPFSLMIGVRVRAEAMTLNINRSELADARWLKKSEVAAVLSGATHLGWSLPSKIAIARALLEAWVKEES